MLKSVRTALFDPCDVWVPLAGKVAEVGTWIW